MTYTPKYSINLEGEGIEMKRKRGKKIRVMMPKGYNRDFPAKLRAAAHTMGITPQQMHARKEEILEAWKDRTRAPRRRIENLFAMSEGARSLDHYCDPNSGLEHEGHIGIRQLIDRHRVPSGAGDNSRASEGNSPDGGDNLSDEYTNRKANAWVPEDQFYDETESTDPDEVRTQAELDDIESRNAEDYE